MSTTHRRIVESATFADALGLQAESGNRLPHSPVKLAVTYYLDIDGNELGYVRHEFLADGTALNTAHAIPAASPADVAQRATIWL
jgi:hypothetical protein